MDAPLPTHLDITTSPFAQTVIRHLRVSNATGLHLRAAAEIVKCARAFDARITFEFRGVQADARSILSLTCLAAASGSIVTVTAVGFDATEAVRVIAELFASGFGEICQPLPVAASARPGFAVGW
jgi:phosphocarrier protein